MVCDHGGTQKKEKRLRLPPGDNFFLSFLPLSLPMPTELWKERRRKNILPPSKGTCTVCSVCATNVCVCV